MEKGIIKMVIIVMVISITLLLVGECLAMYSGGLFMKSVSTSDQTNQDNGTGVSDSSSPINQKSMTQKK